MLLYVKDVINLLKTFDQDAVLFIGTDPDCIDLTHLSKAHDTSTLGFDKKCFNIETEELNNLPDNTKTITLFPQI